MFSNVYLDVAIGLIFIYLLYSLLVTAIQEVISSFLNFRGETLYKAVRQMLLNNGSDILAKQFYSHPLIKKLTFEKGLKKYPSYLNGETFARVLKDILPDLHLGKGKELELKDRLALLPDGDLKKTLQTYMQVKPDFSNIMEKAADADAALGKWFDETMDRLTGFYKRKIQWIVFTIGFVLAAAFNVNTFSIFKKLSTDEKAREKIVNQAVIFMEQNKDFDSILIKKRAKILSDSLSTEKDTLRKKSIIDTILKKENEELYKEFTEKRNAVNNLINEDIAEANNTLGIGWKNADIHLRDSNKINLLKLFKMLFGWIITGLAITLGAPFWFDLLKKLIQIRGAGVRPATLSEKQAAEKKK